MKLALAGIAWTLLDCFAATAGAKEADQFPLTGPLNTDHNRFTKNVINHFSSYYTTIFTK
jgi:hypothetical protein